MTENCVYVIHALTTKYYKIGRTIDVNGRLRGIQTSIPFYDLALAAVHYCEDYIQFEKLLHEKYSDQRLRNSEWFELTSSDLLFLTGETDNILEDIGFIKSMEDEQPSEDPKSPRKGWSKHSKTIHDLFPSQVDGLEQPDEIEEKEKSDNKSMPKKKKAPEGPTEGMLFASSRYEAVKELTADMAREIESALGTEKYEPEWSHALEGYADALDAYAGEYTYSINLEWRG